MDKLLVPKDWFEAIDSDSYFEVDFEGRLRANASELFPDWFFVPFKTTVTARDTGYGNKKPDFALIDRAYRQWWVVEAEISSHSLNDHVLPQAVVFSLGQYNNHHVQHLCKADPNLDRDKLSPLVLNVTPGVLVVVNDEVPGWAPILHRHSVDLCVVKPYRDNLGNSAYLVRGRLPRPHSTLLTYCRRADGLPRALLVENHHAVPFENGASVELLGPTGRPASWRFFLAGDRAYLMSTRAFPFAEDDVDFELHRPSDGTITIVPVEKRRNPWRSR